MTIDKAINNIPSDIIEDPIDDEFTLSDPLLISQNSLTNITPVFNLPESSNDPIGVSTIRNSVSTPKYKDSLYNLCVAKYILNKNTKKNILYSSTITSTNPFKSDKGILLWYGDYDDGDSEDFDETEVLNAIDLYQPMQNSDDSPIASSDNNTDDPPKIIYGSDIDSDPDDPPKIIYGSDIDSYPDCLAYNIMVNQWQLQDQQNPCSPSSKCWSSCKILKHHKKG